MPVTVVRPILTGWFTVQVCNLPLFEAAEARMAPDNLQSSTTTPVPAGDAKRAFEQAGLERQPSLAAEFIDFLRYNKKWWLLPIVLALLMVGLLAFLTTTGAAPFIYTIF